MLISSKARSCHLGILDIRQLCDCLHESTIMVEVGSYAGESASLFASYGHIIKIYCIDPWKNHYDDEHDSASWRYPMELVEKSFDERMSVYSPSKYVKMKTTSLEACIQFEDKSLDFVYIDGMHTYKAVTEDIACWLPKIKPKECIGGHDYHPSHPEVIRAINDSLGIPDKVFCYGSWIKYLK